MIRRPPRSTLFPSRRSSDLEAAEGWEVLGGRAVAGYRRHRGRVETGVGRSEEHTSELQSRPHLVCRLLLEKKKKTAKDTPMMKQQDVSRPASSLPTIPQNSP